MFRTSNPTLNQDAFKPAQTWDDVYGPEQKATQRATEKAAVKEALAGPGHMTVNGVAQKSAALLSILVVVAVAGWHLTLPEQYGGMGVLSPFLAWIGALVLGLPMIIVAGMKPKLAKFIAPVYAAVEGIFVGSISAFAAVRFAPEPGESAGALAVNQGLIFNAGALTFAIFAAMLGAYWGKLIRPGKTFYAIVITGTIGAALYGVVALLLHFTGISSTLASVYSFDNGGMISIGFSLLLVGLASLNLILDFDQIANGERNKAPKYMEWYSSMALLVTLVWLYIEVLRLLSKLQSQD